MLISANLIAPTYMKSILHATVNFDQNPIKT